MRRLPAGLVTSHSGGSGTRPPAIGPDARSSLTEEGANASTKSAARSEKSPRWSAERRAGQRHWPAVPSAEGIGPTARRATGCGDPHRRLSALHPPSSGDRNAGEPGASQTTRAAKLWIFTETCRVSKDAQRLTTCRHRSSSFAHPASLRMSLRLRFPDLAQDLVRVLAQPRRRPLARHRPSADHDRRAHAGNCSALGGRARQIELHAAVDHLRVAEHRFQRVDRPRRHADRFELGEDVGALSCCRHSSDSRATSAADGRAGSCCPCTPACRRATARPARRTVSRTGCRCRWR